MRNLQRAGRPRSVQPSGSVALALSRHLGDRPYSDLTLRDGKSARARQIVVGEGPAARLDELEHLANEFQLSAAAIFSRIPRPGASAQEAVSDLLGLAPWDAQELGRLVGQFYPEGCSEADAALLWLHYRYGLRIPLLDERAVPGAQERSA